MYTDNTDETGSVLPIREIRVIRGQISEQRKDPCARLESGQVSWLAPKTARNDGFSLVSLVSLVWR